jgi:XRE family transcriptional regulator, regulator of sulfur utilization
MPGFKEMNPCRSLGAKIRQARLEKDLSLEELAFRSGITLETLRTIEKGEANPRLTTLCQIAKALDRRLEELT